MIFYSAFSYACHRDCISQCVTHTCTRPYMALLVTQAHALSHPHLRTHAPPDITRTRTHTTCTVRGSLSSHSRAHTRIITPEERGQRRAPPLSLNTHTGTCRWGTSPLVGWHVHAAMLTRASPSVLAPPSVSRVLRRHLHLDHNKLSHLPETIFNGLTSLE